MLFPLYVLDTGGTDDNTSDRLFVAVIVVVALCAIPILLDHSLTTSDIRKRRYAADE